MFPAPSLMLGLGAGSNMVGPVTLSFECGNLLVLKATTVVAMPLLLVASS